MPRDLKAPCPTERLRPSPDAAMSREEFERWYWPVTALETFCDLLDISKVGRKHELRERVASTLAGVAPASCAKRATRTRLGIDWKRATLASDTTIDETISFGPNVRRFFKAAIGKQFVCHGDFMEWVRNNPGRTLADAVEAWLVLEARKQDPEFRREIATCNNYLQYLRDIRDANPTLSLQQARRCWDEKKLRPAQQGVVVYEPSDIAFLDRR